MYVTTGLTLDTVFPLLYATLLSMLITRCYRPETACALVFVPLLAAAADLLENFTVAYLAITFDERSERPSSAAWLAAFFTAAKWALTIASLVIVAIGLVSRVR